MNTVTGVEATQAMTAVVRLLDHATTRVYAHAEAEGSRSPLFSVGLGVALAAGEALRLIPDGVDVASDVPVEDDPVRLLRAAEELLEMVPIGQRTRAVSDLVISVAELICEATA